MMSSLKGARNDDRREDDGQAGGKDRTCHGRDKRDWSCYREALRGRRRIFITGRREKELASAVKNIGGSVTGVQGDVSQSVISNDSSLRFSKRRVI
jgi:hypothetical protein